MDLKSLPDALQEQYEDALNQVLNPQKLKLRDVVIWRDVYGHQWAATISNRLYLGQGCPFCAGKRVLAGYNDLTTTYPKLALQWHPTRNGTLTPKEVSAGSGKNVWWVCDEKHEWKAPVARRAKKQSGCPVCLNRIQLAGYNDLATFYPRLAAQWHPTCNGTLTPSNIYVSSNQKVWWMCEYGHEWKASVQKRCQGQNCPVCSNRVVQQGVNDVSTTHPYLISQLHPTKNRKTLEEVTAGSGVKMVWVCARNHQWSATVKDRALLNHGCPSCSSFSRSQAEETLAVYIFSLGFSVQNNQRNIIVGQEIDIYIPDKQIGVEFNGLYWHSEAAGKDKFYHERKFWRAEAVGVQLIQIWEDDWNRNPELVKRLLAHKLGVSDQPVVYARKTRVEALTTAMARVFLDQNHIQGYASGSYYLGLRDIETQGLVAVMVLKKEPGKPGTLNIVRFATSTRVPGGFTKLLKYAEREYKPDKFITFADHCVSDGGLYETTGFVNHKYVNPDFMYLVGRERKHKFGYRLKKFRTDPNLKYVEGLTERQLAALNGLHRVWDAGKTLYVKQVPGT